MPSTGVVWLDDGMTKSWNETRDSTQPHMFIQWKGTDLCMDFDCTCGNSGHIDGYFCYYVECPACGLVWKMADKLEVTQVDPADAPSTGRRTLLD